MKRKMTTLEIANYTGVSTATICNHVKKLDLKHFKIGCVRYFNKKSIDVLINLSYGKFDIKPITYDKGINGLYERVKHINPELAEEILLCDTMEEAKEVEKAYYKKMGYDKPYGSSNS